MLWYVVLPMLRPTTFYLLVTGVIAALQVFGLVYVIFSRRGAHRRAASRRA